MNYVSDVTQLPKIIDTSRHNGQLTESQLRSTNCVLLIIRDGISWGYKDDQFDYYRSLAKGMNLPWCAYHVLYPSQPAQPQVENVKLIIKDDPGPCKIPVWNDLELAQDMPPSVIANCCLEFGEGLQREYGGEKGIYSRTTFIDYYMRGQSWLNTYLWWLAQYLSSGLEHPGPYTVPQGLSDDRVIIQQTGHKYQIPGHTGDIDINRWLQSIDMLEWFTGTQVQVPLTMEEKVNKLWAAHPELH